MENTHNLVVERFLNEGKNVLFIPESGSEFTDSFISYLYKNFISSTTMKGSYFHLNMPLSIEEKIKEMTYDEADELFLTDDKIEHDISYNGWDFSFDNQTGAAYFYDPKTLLELYCSPSFENEWGRITFCLSSQYNFEDGDNTKTIEELNVIDMAGDINGQYKIWEKTAHAIIDNIKNHVSQYEDFALETGVNEAVRNFIGGEKMCDLFRNNREQLARIDVLTENLIKEVLKTK